MRDGADQRDTTLSLTAATRLKVHDLGKQQPLKKAILHYAISLTARVLVYHGQLFNYGEKVKRLVF
jgi:hypothetical protein